MTTYRGGASTNRRRTRLLARWVSGVRRHAWLVVLLALASAGLSLRYAAGNLGINTDTADIISPQLAWRQDYIDYKSAFPADVDTLIVVVSAETPALASEAGRSLAQVLREARDVVDSVETPGAGEYFERHALLYLDEDELADLGDRLARAQPFLGILARDPSLTGVSNLLQRIVDARDGDEAIALEPLLVAMADSAEAAANGKFHQVSWQRLMLDRSPEPRELRRILVVKPRLDWSRLLPAGPAIERIRALAAANDLTASRGVRVRITGAVAMEHEELDTVVKGAERAGVLALVLVGIVLAVSLRSLRLVVSSLLTLVTGLIWTAAFAAAAVGHLNLISVAFAVLYIGLGIAYAIHFCLRYRELVEGGLGHAESLTETAGDVGGSLLVCAITTGIGFYAFVPTDFVGVSELGIISGTGMFISLFASLTVLPALLTLMPLGARPMPRPRAEPLRRAIAAWPARHRRAVLTGALLATACACIALPSVRFDGNPIGLRDPGSESVTTFIELLSDRDTAPVAVSVLARDAAEASELAVKLESVDQVSGTRTLASFIPSDQRAKLALIEELDLLLGPDLGRTLAASHDSTDDRLMALDELIKVVERLESDAGVGTDAGRLRAALVGLREAQPAVTAGADPLQRFERSLLDGLGEQLRLLRLSLTAGEVDVENLPVSLLERWIGEDGRHRVAIYPKSGLFDQEAMASFLEAVRRVAPGSTGTPVVYVESARVVVRAFQQAFVLALGCIVIVLFVLLGRLRPVMHVLLPLLMASILTVAVMVLLDVPFNFANVIALPLLLGVGVDNGIHMVHRMQAAPPADGNVLETSTARAVVASALTTVFSFGNLAFSPHPGTASMGLVLCIGLSIMLLASLLVLPALIAGSAEARSVDGGRDWR